MQWIKPIGLKINRIDMMSTKKQKSNVFNRLKIGYQLITNKITSSIQVLNSRSRF